MFDNKLKNIQDRLTSVDVIYRVVLRGIDRFINVFYSKGYFILYNYLIYIYIF